MAAGKKTANVLLAVVRLSSIRTRPKHYLRVVKWLHSGNTPTIAKHDFEDGDDVPGSFIAIGPNIKRDVRLMGFTVSVFDIAPTILKP